MSSNAIHTWWRRAQEPRCQPWMAVLVALLASAPRIWFAVIEHPLGLYVAADMAHYESCADRLRQGLATAADTFTPVGYPALLAFLFTLSHKNYVLVAWAQVLLGSATAGLVHLIAYRASRSFPTALAASLATIFYFPVIFYAGLLLSETTFGFFVVLCVWLSLRALDHPTRASLIFAGLAMGAATLVRPNFALAIPIMAAWWAILAARRARFVFWALAGAAFILLPICIYNSWLMGRPTGLATNGGVNFFLAHSDYTWVRFPASDAIGGIAPRPNAVAGQPEKIFDAAFHAYDEAKLYGLALDGLLAEPSRLVRDLRHISDGFGLGGLSYWPGWMGRNEWLVIPGYCLFALCVLPSCWHLVVLALRRPFEAREHAAHWLLWGILGSMVLTLYLFLGDPRIRVPFDPLWIVLGADAWRELVVRMQEAAAKTGEQS